LPLSTNLKLKFSNFSTHNCTPPIFPYKQTLKLKFPNPSNPQPCTATTQPNLIADLNGVATRSEEAQGSAARRDTMKARQGTVEARRGDLRLRKHEAR